MHDRWRTLLAYSLIAGVLGLAVFLDATDGVTVVTTQTFGYFLLVNGFIGVLIGLSVQDRLRRFFIIRAIFLGIVGAIIVDLPWHNDVVSSFLFGIAFAVDGMLRIISSFVIRFPRWRWIAFGGVVELILAMLSFTDWPLPYTRTVPFCITVFLLLMAVTGVRFALLLRALPENGSVLTIPGMVKNGWYDGIEAVPDQPEPPAGDGPAPELVVRVWTPVGSVEELARRRVVVDRYIAAVDKKGRISTGHAALELQPDVYVSHYPAEEIDRESKDFLKQLRACASNDVKGRFMPSYAYEVSTWVPADQSVNFHRFNGQRLRNHWAQYSRDDTYNLARRNCSVSVAMALNAAMEGMCPRGGPIAWRLLCLLCNPDLWLAAMLRHRAESMTWTPGLVLDYAFALRRVVQRPAKGWVARMKTTIAGFRHARELKVEEQLT